MFFISVWILRKSSDDFLVNFLGSLSGEREVKKQRGGARGWGIGGLERKIAD